MDEMIPAQKRSAILRYLQYGCLLAVVLAELVFLSPMGQRSGLALVTVDYFLAIPAMAFLMLSFARDIKGKGLAPMVLGLGMLVWFCLAQGFRAYFERALIEPGGMICCYALALPLAFGMEDGQRQRGLKTLALTFLAEGLLLTVLGLGLRFGFLPQDFADTVRWDGARLLQLSHPNNCAVMLMLGIGICLALCFRTKRVWCRAIFVVLALAQFGVQIMNHGRISTVATCLLVGGILFCAIRKTGWKRAPLALAAAVGVMVMMYISAQGLYTLHEKSLIQASLQAAQEETEGIAETVQESTGEKDPSLSYLPGVKEDGTLEVTNTQNDLRQDLANLNGRTAIWKAAIQGAKGDRKLLISGTDDPAAILSENGVPYAQHTHNSFLETLYTLGLPGLLIALAVTLLALRGAALLLWRNEDLWKSSMAMIALCLLACGLLEPYLFTAKYYHHYLNIFFLTVVGYLHQWTVEERKTR